MKNITLQTKIEIPLGDSKEVLQDYYIGKILQLERSLGCLNLLEHPIEIKSICSKIIAIKAMLRQKAWVKSK
jgi:hypothetical protein